MPDTNDHATQPASTHDAATEPLPLAATRDSQQPAASNGIAPSAVAPTATEAAAAREPGRERNADELHRTRRAHARALRGEHYKGRLTMKTFEALEPLLDDPTPERFVEKLPPYPDRPREPRQTVSLHYQLRVMNDTFGRAHWKALTHYADGGKTARAWVVIGNRLATVKLDETTGELIPGERAEILEAIDGWGGVESAHSKGDLLKSSQTSALKRLLGQLGPGRDVLEAPIVADAGGADPAGPDSVVPLPRYRPDLTAVAGAGDRKASELQVKMLLGIVRARGLPPSQVANLIREAVGAEPGPYASEVEAQEFVDAKLSKRAIVLPFDLVTPLKHLLQQADPQPPKVPARPPGTAHPDRSTADDALPFDPSGAEAA